MTYEYKKPIPTRASKNSVSTFAEQMSSQLSFEAGDPVESIVSQVGGSISYRSPVGDEIPDSIRVEPNRRFEIFLSSLTSPSRDRFTIAHELGHFFLHFPLVEQSFPGHGMKATRWVDENDADLQRCEWEANWFAASFLMPSKEYLSAYAKGGIPGVATHFGVSEKAAAVRAKSIGIMAAS